MFSDIYNQFRQGGAAGRRPEVLQLMLQQRFNEIMQRRGENHPGRRGIQTAQDAIQNRLAQAPAMPTVPPVASPMQGGAPTALNPAFNTQALQGVPDLRTAVLSSIAADGGLKWTGGSSGSGWSNVLRHILNANQAGAGDAAQGTIYGPR